MKNRARQHAITVSAPSTTVRRDEGGSAPTEARPLSRLDLGLEGSGPVASMPVADCNDTPPPTAQMARADGCPACVVNYTLPRITREQEHGFVAYYVCEDCGHDWITSWKD